MKPVLIVDGKELDVSNIYYRNGEVLSVQVDLGDNVYESYAAKVYLFANEADNVIDFDKALKFVGRYDDLIEHLEKMLKEGNDDLAEIAIEAMESKVSGLPFNSHLSESQKFYQSEKQRVMGMIDAVEEVKAFSEGWYDDEKPTKSVEKEKYNSTVEQLRDPIF